MSAASAEADNAAEADGATEADGANHLSLRSAFCGEFFLNSRSAS